MITRLLGVMVLAAVLAACGSTTSATSAPETGPTAESTTGPPTPTPSVTPSRTPTTPPLGTVPPGWLGKRPLPRTAAGFGEIRPTPKVLRDRRFTLPDALPMLPGAGFAARVERAPAAVLARSTWVPGCPVARAELDWVRLTFWGFDHRRHTGELLVNHTASAGLVRVFGDLYRDRFPIEQMQITTRAELDAAPTGDGNDTEAFVCRPVVGETVFSQHAYGLAVDVDPFQNPYTKGDLVLPELASAYVDRHRVRPGMVFPEGPVVRAFTSIGWTWGGTWHSLKDLQHFSATGG